MFSLEAATKATIKVNAKLPENYIIVNLGQTSQVIGIVIHCDGIWVSLVKNSYITKILRQFGMEHICGVSMPMDPYVKLDLAENHGEKEMEHITDFQAVMGILIYRALATQQDILYPVVALSR